MPIAVVWFLAGEFIYQVVLLPMLPTIVMSDKGISVIPPPQDPPILKAILAHDEVKIKKLLAEGADPNAVSKSKESMLHWAMDDPKALQALIEAGANVNALSNGQSLYVLAKERGGTEAIKLLLDAGADTNQWIQPMKKLLGESYPYFDGFEIMPAVNTRRIVVGGKGIRTEVRGNEAEPNTHELRIQIDEIRLEKRTDQKNVKYKSLGLGITVVGSGTYRDVYRQYEFSDELSQENPVQLIKGKVFKMKGSWGKCIQGGCKVNLLLSIIGDDGYDADNEKTAFAPFNVGAESIVTDSASLPIK